VRSDQVNCFFSSQWGRFMWERKFHNKLGPFRWNVFSQPLEEKSVKWIFFTSSGVILITFFSLPMVGHFTLMGSHFKSFFSSPPMGGHFKWLFFLPLMGDRFKWLFFSFQWGVISKNFSFPRVLFLHFYIS
jgi:hypothetical protein